MALLLLFALLSVTGCNASATQSDTASSNHEATSGLETSSQTEETTAGAQDTGKKSAHSEGDRKNSDGEAKQEPQKTRKPIEGKVSKDALKDVPKFRDFYSEGNPKTPKNLVKNGSTAGAIPAVKPFNFGRDPGGPDDKTLYLSIPKIDRYDVPVYNSTSEDDLTRSAVHVPATGFPWQSGANTFIAGHRLGYPNTGSYYVFYRLNELVAGDEISVRDSDGRSFVYRVTDQKTVGPENIDVMNPVEGKSIISLQTCTLPDYSERLIVQGELVEKDV
ncbi:MAG TPA: class E sortase [Rubrobacteraceae bacterium]|nr:class E sortase [Rubrobacteraceae bacterium]